MFGKKTKLLAAARGNDVAGVEKYYMKRSNCLDACIEAVKNDAPDALQKLLEINKGFHFAIDNPYDDSRRALQLFAAARDCSASEKIVSILYDMNRTKCRGYNINRELMMPNTPLYAIKDCLESAPAAGHLHIDFDTCVNQTGLASTEKLTLILSFKPEGAEAQRTIDNALIAVAAKGDIEKAELLLRHGANANYAAGQSLKVAGECGQYAMVELLLDHVALDIHGQAIAMRLQNMETYPAAARRVADAVAAAIKDGARAAPRAAPAAAESEGNYTRLDSHTLEERQTLSDGGTLTALFNFASGQQHILFTDRNGNGQTPVVVPFRDIDEKLLSALREIFDALAAPQPEKPANDAAAGGKLKTSDVAARIKKSGL